ncbi:SusC/RagA family TonB-linked outer membrane protein [Flavobacterium oreochromis]|uniref:SusC/RagA family TonB-linked outer membrane protein n=1 Tax=Flavobacterium oreochromis TaxID=2906078 RepID=UPI003858A0EB
MRSKFKWIFTLLLALTMQFSFAQEKTITGVVTDANGPLPGVNVVVKGTQRGVSSGFDGKYSIKAKEGETLVFSFMGMREVAKVVGASNVMNTVMQSDAKQIGEVVVTSFGVKRDKKTLGFSTPKINSEELTAAKSTNITNQIGGKIAGLRVSGSGGSFTGSSVIIRGFTTFTGSNQPLYVVDGVPIDNSGGNNQLQQGASSSNRAVDINPEDVESLVVLKDAASTSIYGARGASGVILITTKKGKKGVGTVTFTSSVAVGNVNRLPEYQNEYAQGNLGKLTTGNIGSVTKPGGWFIGSWGPRINGQEIVNSFGQKEILQAYPDNIKDIFKTAINTQNNLSFSGGTDKSSYRIAIGNTEETYVIDNNRMKRTSMTFSGNSQVTDKLNVGLSLTYTNNNSVRTLQGNQLSNPLFRAYFIPRTYNLSGLPFEDEKGTQLYAGGEDNPYWSIKHNLYNDKVDRIFGNFNLRYDFNSWLNAELKVGSDFFNLKSNGFDEIGNRGGGFTGTGGRLVGGVVNNITNVHNINTYLTLNAVRKFNDFTFSATLGNETVNNSRFGSEIIGVGLVIPGFNQIKNTNTYFPSSGTTKTKTYGIFGDLTVEYKKILSLNVKARNDWSSTLAKENNSIFYPGVSGSFVLTEAFPAIKMDDKINLIKFRASLGEVGKGAPAYITKTYYDVSNASDGFGPEIKFPYDGLSGYTLNDVAGNPNLTPEFTREFAYGAEFGFFNNRLTIDGSIYNRTTRNVILPVPVSATSGVTRVYQNAGRLSTKGVEVMVSGTPVKTENFRWDLGVNYTQFKSVVEELAPGVDNIFLGGFSTPNIRLVAGDEYGQIYGTAYQRDANGNLLIQPTINPDGKPNPNAGLLIPTANVQKIGNPNPKFTMGVTNTFTYKNISLYALVDVRKGGDQYSRNIADVQRNGVAIETAEYPRFLADGVTLNKPYLFQGVYASGPDAGKPNTTMITAQSYYGNAGKYAAAEGFIYDTSWYRLRELALTYKLGKKALNNSIFKQIELGVFGRNLFLRAPNYPHFDPEQNALGVSNAQGLEFNSLPSTRTIGGNLKIVF